jgi:hypothetical protein
MRVLAGTVFPLFLQQPPSLRHDELVAFCIGDFSVVVWMTVVLQMAPRLKVCGVIQGRQHVKFHSVRGIPWQYPAIKNGFCHISRVRAANEDLGWIGR